MRKSTKIDKIKELPKKPGVYFLKNKNGELFYIGKANNIKSRVQSHKNDDRLFAPEKIYSIEWIETANEIEALLKESEYIKKLQPKMNIRLRDDKRYFYVGITKEKLPRIFLTHQPSTTAKGKVNILYLGPFTDGGALKTTLKYLRRIFPYYTTNPKKPGTGKIHGPLPCSRCHIGLCPGPVPTNELKKKEFIKEYKKNIRSIKNVLSGKRRGVIRDLKKNMKEASKEKRFEDAATARDIIAALENIFEHENFVLPWSPDKSALATSEQGINEGKYLAQLTGNKKPIKTIEGYDISNIQGKNPTASMVRFKNGEPDKSLYRKFNIKAPDEPNDYLMMREVLRRRLKNDWPLPDLILIDGGRGQLNAALFELKTAKIKIPAVSLAKREEELYLPDKKAPIRLDTMPEQVENLLRRVRDEAHRFAVSHHRKKRAEKYKK
ncbi:MAG: GIY-YIG nuclease family protein [Candidatus Spechtbacterales bacterium]|nr:GIY-YIG nuclease family protein [Candidatus Spechtbacterales bacterium]